MDEIHLDQWRHIAILLSPRSRDRAGSVESPRRRTSRQLVYLTVFIFIKYMLGSSKPCVYAGSAPALQYTRIKMLKN